MAYGTAISNKTGVKDMESEGENSSLFSLMTAMN